ncbi:hypothetical protein [Streptomyces sp. NPDC003077]|uniref:hypothetical protein n=1 Tax=Streptomyces sp. NPDC003077 TaxID=3154443 RepID=UPI0033B589AE
MAHAAFYTGKDLDAWLYEAKPVPGCQICQEQWDARQEAFAEHDTWAAFAASQAIRRHPRHQ